MSLSLLTPGAIRINFEDRVVKGAGLYSVDRQAQRIAVICNVVKQKSATFFIDAPSDVFFEAGEAAAQALGDAIERAEAYRAAGASEFSRRDWWTKR